jgi:hypothetical protein
MARQYVRGLVLYMMAVGSGLWASAQATKNVPTLAVDQVELRNVKAETVNYKGKAAVRVIDAGPARLDDAGRLAVIRGSSFTDGSIEIELTGDTAPDAPENLRGFVGIAFRVAADTSRFECFYLRPKNGRSPDPVQKSHSAQYISIPGFPWQKLRSETPGKYESYVDVAPGEWTKVKIVVSGDKAELYVNGSAQPALVVNDLKQPRAAGAIALWVGPGTIAHFANLRVTP